MYTAALIRKNNIKENLKAITVVDVPKYFLRLEKKFEDLNELYKNKVTLKKINRVTDELEKDTRHETDDAKELIENEVKHELESFGRDLDVSIKQLHDEIHQSKINHSIIAGKLHSSKSELNYNFILKSICQVTNVVSSTLVFFGPVSAAAGAVLAVPSQIGLAFAVSNDKDREKELQEVSTKLQAAGKSIHAKINEIKKIKAENLQNLITETSDNVKDKPELFEKFQNFWKKKKSN